MQKTGAVVTKLSTITCSQCGTKVKTVWMDGKWIYNYCH